jgi:TonB-linked SusC/RagA family outer membrane protein
MNEKLKFIKQWGAIVLLLVFSLNVAAQDITVQGTIIDEFGEPATGATIQVRGTGQGTIAGIDGNFTLSVPAGSILVISFVGYQTQEVAASANMRITLQPDAAFLDELIVVGYGTLRRSEITAAVTHLRSEDFNTISSPNVMELARGRIPGLIVTNQHGTDPREGASLQIRGVGTMRGSTAPLVVIDGIPGANLTTVAPEDIESFTILRDASAAAIYGSRGANGVILITTRSAARGEQRTRFEYSTTISHEYVYRLPRVLTAAEYREWMAGGADNFGAHLMVDHGGEMDWMRALVNTGNISQTHNFSATGGHRGGNYRVSFYYMENNPIAIRSSQTRWGGRMNTNLIGLNDRLEMTFNTSVDFRNRDNVGTRDAWRTAALINPTMTARQEDGDWRPISGADIFNPLERFENSIDYTERMTWTGSARAAVNILPGLRAFVQGNWEQRHEIRNQYRFKAEHQRGTEIYVGEGRAQKWSNRDIRRSVETTFDFQRVFNDIHSFNAVAGHSYEFNVYEAFYAWNTGFMSDAFLYNRLQQGTGRMQSGVARSNMGSEKRNVKLAAFFGRINYVFMNRYQLTATLRREGSSRFGPNYRWGNFPSISAGWVLSQENFIRDNFDFVDFLQLRGGFGVTGSMPGQNYMFMSTFTTGGYYIMPGDQWIQTWGPSRSPSPDLRWERREEFNIGLEFALFNRLRGTIDVYSRTTNDLLEEVTVPQPSNTHTIMWANIGSIRNRGFEIGLNANVIENRNFSWDVTASYFYQVNRLMSLSNEYFFRDYRSFGGVSIPGNNLGDAIRTEIGQPLGRFYGRRFAGLTDTGQWLWYNRYNEQVTNAQFQPAYDRAWIGNGVPPHHASLINNFRFGRFDFSFMLRGKFGFDILNVQDMFFGNLAYASGNILKSAITTHANVRQTPQISDYYLERGDFVKLDNVTFGYTIRFANQDWVRSMRLFVAGNNLATFTGFTGLTPEVQDTGLTTGISGRSFFPVSSTLIFGFNIGF